jgi:5-formyltetrahydrofolate cyclo-ligase
MQPDLHEAKVALRRQINAALTAMSPEQRAAASAGICARLRELPAWQNAQSVLLFAPMTMETDVWPLLAEALAAGKTAGLPRYHPADKAYVTCRVQNVGVDVVTGHFGIREPAARCAEIPLSRFEFILVPGVAFDAHGHRLGRGRGYYDRLLTDARGVKCGIAFDEQLLADVPVGPLDVFLDFILTPTRYVKCGD